MTPERLQELLAAYFAQPLSPRQAEQMLAYLDLLLKWNAKMNLTAIREPEPIVRRHFGESLALAQWVLDARPDATVADLGSGAGIPGLPMAIYAPGAVVTLIESQNKKATFLREVVRALDLKNVTVENRRGEEIDKRFKIVAMRAVDKFESALTAAVQLVDTRGTLALLISADQVAAAQKLLRGIDIHWSPQPVGERSRNTVMLLGYL